MGTQRTNTIRQAFRQHRNYTINQIDRRSTINSFLINNRIRFYIMCYIGNMYAYFPISIFKFTDRKSIIKIFCIFRVNGKGRNFTKIFTLLIFFFRNFISDFIRQFCYFIRIRIRQSEFCKNRMDFSIVFSNLT